MAYNLLQAPESLAQGVIDSVYLAPKKHTQLLSNSMKHR